MGLPHGIGIVGLGNISGQYLDALAGHPDVRLVAVADLDPARTAEVAAATGARATDLAGILSDDGVAAVLNLTTPALHVEVDRAIIAAGKHVYAEKPLAVELVDGRAVLESADAAGVRVGSAPDTVLGTGIQTARHAIDEGLIGRPLAASAVMNTPGHERWHPNPDFYYQPGGGPVLDMGPYYVSALITLLGPVTAVTAVTSRVRPSRTIGSGPRAGEVVPVDVDTHVSAILQHAAGAVSTLVTSFDSVATTAAPIEVHGELGTLAVPDPNTFGGVVRLHPLGEDWRDLPTSAGYVDAARGVGLLDLLTTPDGEEPRAGGAFALHVLDVMTAALEAGRTGRRVELTTSAPRPRPVPLTVWRAGMP